MLKCTDHYPAPQWMNPLNYKHHPSDKPFLPKSSVGCLFCPTLQYCGFGSSLFIYTLLVSHGQTDKRDDNRGIQAVFRLSGNRTREQ